MREKAKKICAAWIAVWILFSGSIHITVSAAPSSYSKTSNSGERGEICTTLEGTSAGSYYTGSYTYEAMAALSSGSLKSTLNTLLSTTHKKTTSYADCKEKVTSTDCENNDTGHFTTLYTSYSATYGQFNGGAGWNREHVWPQSLGGFKTSGAGADLHHIRPSESKTNSDRGSLKYGYVTGGSTSKGNLSGLTGGEKGGYYEPLDEVKGDVARIILYVYVRYYDEYSKCGSVTNVFQSVDVLLEWCELDPVDTWEMGRNEVVGAIQGNRNVFIDYPEYAWLIFGREVPSDMTTPSGEAKESGGSGTQTTKPATQAATTAPATTVATTTAATTTSESANDGECEHAFGPWEEIGSSGGRSRTCSKCGIFEFATVTEAEDAKNGGCNSSIGASYAIVAIVPMLGAAFIARRKKK